MTAELLREVSSLRESVERLTAQVEAMARRMPDPPEWDAPENIPRWFPGRAGLSRRSLFRMEGIRRRKRGGKTEFYVPDIRAFLESDR